ncbi:MAG: LTA synthase family protein [Lachnospiraceae bacterium]|nr:LTA synthase family protein [Lachnospiraceae bacterium]MBE5945032.1 LTA synthase family protein [Lachnospiraceae bacterium]
MFFNKTKEKSISRIKGSLIRYIVVSFVYILSIFLSVVCFWSKRAFDIEFNEIINTLMGPLGGAGNAVLYDGLVFCVPIILVLVVLVVGVYLVYDIRKSGKLSWERETNYKKVQVRKLIIIRRIWSWVSVGLFALMLLYVDHSYQIGEYVHYRMSDSGIYEKCYVSPKSVNITRKGKKKNLIYIYLESMESSYASKDAGGFQEVNYIPKLTELANKNVSFSNNEMLGGFYSNYGATWTLGALYTSLSGVPYALPLDGNQAPTGKEFASGLITLGDFTKSQGYNNEFLCGSDADFAGRRMFLDRHGDYKIYDYYSAVKNDVIKKGYYVWWGIEDALLYGIAKEEIKALASKDEPFNFTMLTADTHFPEGFVCYMCEGKYDTVTGNVLDCADRQLADFIDWCSKQPFYKDTVIVIVGDHTRMDTTLVEGLTDKERTVYNCFINAAVKGMEKISDKNRKFATFDLFPTILSAMGYKIEGERLGLGTNMFSGKKTLYEKYGYHTVEGELQKNSDFYLKEFAPELIEGDKN